jgi:hypothetical protein
MAKKMYEETHIAAIAEMIRKMIGSDELYSTETMSAGVEEVGVVGYLAGLSEIPLHYNYIVTLSVAFEDLFRQGGIEGNPYTNSFRVSDFSRTPKVGDIFSLIFTDKNKNNVYSFAEITKEPVQNSAGVWFSPFKVIYAIMLHNTAEIVELKEAVNGLETEEWTLLVENADGTTTTKTKKVCIKQ